MTEEPSGNERLVQFSDGIMAVTITLLALDIRLRIDSTELSDPALLQEFWQLLPRVGAYALSFMVIATFWNAHRRKFAHISRSHGVLVWLNFIFLLTLGLIPFVTDVLAENGGQVATIAYAGLVGLASLLLAAVGYVARHRNLIDEAHRNDPENVHLLSSFGTASIFLASIPVAFLDPDVAKYIWLALIPVNILQSRRRLARPS